MIRLRRLAEGWDRGRAKNNVQVFSLFGLLNLVLVRRRRMTLGGGGAS